MALKWGRDGVVTDWNPTFAGVALDLGIGVEVYWPYRPQENGSVENLVGWVKGSFFKQRRFLDRADLEQQLRGSLKRTPSGHRGRRACRRRNGCVRKVRGCGRSGSRRPNWRCASRLDVSPMGVVMHDGHPYSMPPDAIGLPGTLYLYRDRVRIVAGRYSAEHERQCQRRRRIDPAGASCAAGRVGLGQAGATLGAGVTGEVVGYWPCIPALTCMRRPVIQWYNI